MKRRTRKSRSSLHHHHPHHHLYRRRCRIHDYNYHCLWIGYHLIKCDWLEWSFASFRILCGPSMPTGDAKIRTTQSIVSSLESLRCMANLSCRRSSCQLLFHFCQVTTSALGKMDTLLGRHMTLRTEHAANQVEMIPTSLPTTWIKAQNLKQPS